MKRSFNILATLLIVFYSTIAMAGNGNGIENNPFVQALMQQIEQKDAEILSLQNTIEQKDAEISSLIENQLSCSDLTLEEDGQCVIDVEQAKLSICDTYPVVIYEGDIKVDDISDLAVLEGLTGINGNLVIQNISELATPFPIILESISGNLDIVETGLTSLNKLENITSIGGELYIKDNAALTSLSGLENITSVGGHLTIAGNASLTGLNGLRNLASIGGYLSIWFNAALTTIISLQNLTSVGEAVTIYNNAALTSLIGLENLTSFQGITISQNDSLTNLSGFETFTSFGGSLTISYNARLTSLSGLENITRFGEYLSIFQNAGLTSLSGLENVTSVEGDLDIYHNAALPQCIIDEWISYVNIGGSLHITPNGSTDSSLCQ